MFGYIKEEVPSRSLKIVWTEVDVSSDGTVQCALHLACSGKGNDCGARALTLIGRYVENVVCVAYSCPIRGWSAQ